MVKKIKREQPEIHNEEENIALEEDAAKEEIALLEQEGDYAEETSVESINLEDKLNEKAEALKAEFAKPFNAKGKKITWLETLDVTSSNPIDQHLNVDDDIKRELFFYNATKENTIAGMIKLKKLGEKINRPDDCFVEMLKSDEQMANVKKEIIKEQQYIKKFEAKKQKLQNIKFAKSIKDQQNKEKSAFKRKTMEGIEKWKEHIKKNPHDYNKIDKFIDGKKKKFNVKDLAGKSVRYKSKEKRLNDMRHYKKKQMKRPGKVKRMMNRNKKNSKKSK